MKTLMRISFLIILAFVFYSSFVVGQDIWQLPLMSSSISLEYLSPSLSNYSRTEVRMYSVIVTGNIKLRNDDRVIIEIPYVHFHMDGYETVYSSSFTYQFLEYSSGNIGNLYLAYEFMDNNEHISTTVGIYFPTASDKEAAPGAGTLFDYDQFALYVPNLLTLHPQFNYHSESNNLFMNIKWSPIITISMKSTQSMHSVDIFAALSIQGGFKAGDFTAAVGWAGNLAVTESGEVSDRIIDQAGAIVGYKFAQVHPELFFRFPISKNLSAVLEYVIGVSARYEF